MPNEFEPPNAKAFFGGLFNVTEYIKDHARLLRFALTLLVWVLLFFGGKAVINHFFPKKQLQAVGSITTESGKVTVNGEDHKKIGILNF